MARMREIGASLDKGYRDDLNYNFGLLEALIGEANGLTDDLRQEMLNYINNLQQQINMLTGENIGELLARLNDSIQQALTAAQEARTAKTATEEATALATTATELAKASALLAEEKADYANEKAVLAQEAADNANQEASNLSQLKIDVVQATQSANEEANNANEKATLANNAADRANLAADSADEAATRANQAADAIEGWGTAEQWVNDKQYVKNNVVTDNGSTWQALRPNIGVTPSEGLDWTCLARKGLDGTGAVSSVNNRFPDSDGNVEIKWLDVPEKPTTFPPSAHTHEISNIKGLQDTLDGKADSSELTSIEQTVNKHLTENGQFEMYHRSGVNLPIHNTSGTSLAFTYREIAGTGADFAEIDINGDIKFKRAGTYMINVRVVFAQNSSGQRYFGVVYNGSIISEEARDAASSVQTYLSLSKVIKVKVNDIIGIALFQDSGATIDVDGNLAKTFLELNFLGDAYPT
ncbi:hypothetical protein Q8G28_03755 [Lysinibacillus capsici]|uniref:hypothetical protein n=1 Tax=Lysinibacillus capsici TaxID=2115968 RepID=UPI0027300CDF|nr:hypothetical protein [Lysinibacillus capsici]MDP1392028.1 hypothetical protein [Lysinibacillus capsici]MDP1412504.1 hypothetical protein [Lysinibacillus capsici]MDP1428864.1 hypothetical protein [Lysinibacillus capsici]